MLVLVAVGAVLVVGTMHMPKPVKKIGHSIVHVFKHGLLHIDEKDKPSAK